MKIAFIGTGNMGGALARAASRDLNNQLYLVNRHPGKAEKLQEEIGGIVTDYREAIQAAELVFLGVKPGMLPELCGKIRPLLEEKADPFAVVSMAAGVTIASLKEMLGDLPIIRIMPNTPVSVGEGMILYTSCADSFLESFLHAMRLAGRFMAVEERLMDAGMAVSGCGPAFVDLFVEALADAGVASGLYRKDAIVLAAQMVLGSAKLILESGKHPGELKDAVCSPGGTTIQGVRKLEEKGFRSAVMEAVLAARDAKI
jgi:pyrroline-5-carboxylate reductase